MPATKSTSHSSSLRLPSCAARRSPPSWPPLCLSNFLSRSISRKPFGALRRPVVAQQAERGLQLREPRAARGVGDLPGVVEEALDVDERRDSGAHAFVFLLTMNAVPMPQFGWQPHFIVPQSAPGPCIRSVTSENAPDADSGNQSRSGSVTPVCVLHVVARGATACSAARARSRRRCPRRAR